MALPKPSFPEPGHDHARCTQGALARADEICRARGQRLTTIRRQVLSALLASHRSLGAYEIIDMLARTTNVRPAPITIYRALEFLTTNGFVHRIESRNAFLACAHDHDSSTTIAFLICERCGAVGEIPVAATAEKLHQAAHATGFTPHLSVVEITGICKHCRTED